MNSSKGSDPLREVWANSNLEVTEVKFEDERPPIFELRKAMVINGITHVQSIWLSAQQLRSVAIDLAI